MTVPTEYSFARCLASKKSVDDRALNWNVWKALANRLPKSSLDRPLRVLEVGAGIGTMIERILSRKLLNYAVYIAVDAQKQNKDLARSRLREWSSNHNLRFEETSADQWCLDGKRKYIEINFKTRTSSILRLMSMEDMT